MIKMDEEINENQSKLFDDFITQKIYLINWKDPQYSIALALNHSKNSRNLFLSIISSTSYQ